MLQITTKFEGEQRTVDLHAVRLPGVNVRAVDLPAADLFRAMTKLGIAGISTSHGWQDLCFRLGVWIQRQDESPPPVARAVV
jgi:hypothetical protein